MLALALFLTGLLLVVGALVVSRVTRRHVAEPTGEGVDLFAPQSVAEVEARRTRLWPVAVAAAGAALVGAGLALPQRAPVRLEPLGAEAEPAPYLVTVQIASAPFEAPEPSPSPTPSATPPAATERPQSAPATPATSTAPPRPGPSVGANTSCFSNALQISYSATARPETTLTGITISLDGRVVEDPAVSGRSQYSGSYQTQGSGGAHTFTLTARGSDGGVTQRSFPVTC